LPYRFLSVFFIFVVKKLPVNEPLIKDKPIMKLIGNLIVSFVIKLTFVLSELFCIPIIKNKNKTELKVTLNIIFLKIDIILEDVYPLLI